MSVLKLILKIVLGLVLVLGLGALILYLLGAYWLSVPPYKGPVSDHFNGKKFFNLQPFSGEKGDFSKWRSKRKPGQWKDWTQAEPGPQPPKRVRGNELRVTFVNHATVLVQTGGLNILTDPMWSKRCSPVSWAGPKRVRPPGLLFEDLPPIDVVLVSHNHYDHMDLPTLKKLAEIHNPQIFCALGNGRFLESKKLEKITELDWWDQSKIQDGVTIHSVPAQHFSSRGLRDRNSALWTGYVIKAPGGSIYFSGDTALGPHFEMIRKRLGPMRLALLPIGAYKPEWFMKRAHMGPRDVIPVAKTLDAATSVAIHFGTFKLGDDGQDEATDVLREEVLTAGKGGPRVWVLGFGEGRMVPK